MTMLDEWRIVRGLAVIAVAGFCDRRSSKFAQNPPPAPATMRHVVRYEKARKLAAST